MTAPDTSAVPLAGEARISLADAARCLPPYRGGRPVNPTTLFRWATGGVRLPDGTRLRLEVARCGNRFLTSHEALDRFIAAQTRAFGVPVGDGPPVPHPLAAAGGTAAIGAVVEPADDWADEKHPADRLTARPGPGVGR